MDGQVRITGDTSQLLTEMQRAGNAVRGFSSDAQGHFGRIQDGIGTMQAKWVALGATILSGAGFKEAVDVSVKLTKEAVSLGKALGINATEASVLNVALGDIYQSSEAMITANGAMTKALKTNESAFTDLGVSTRDQNGNFRNSLDIMLDVNEHLAKFKEGTDRNIEGTKIYGKQWGEVAGLLKLNVGLMEDSRQKAIALNVIVGEESIEATAKYRASMNDVEDVLTAVKKAVGDAVMPVLTDLGNEFSSTGPQKVSIMRQALGMLVAAFYGVKNGIEIIWTSVKTLLMSMGLAFLGLGIAMSKALRMDFSGAKEALSNGWGAIVDINKQGGEDIVAASIKNGEAMQRALENGFNAPKSTPAKSNSGADSRSSGGKAEAETRLQQWQAELEEIKLKAQEKAQAEGRFYEMSKEEERKYWADKRALTTAGSKEETALRKKGADLGLAIMKEGFEAAQEKLKTQMDAVKDDYAQREALAEKFARNAREKFGAESKEYQAALAQQQAMRREHEDKLRQIELTRLSEVSKNSAALIEGSARDAQLQFDLGLISRERLLQLQRGFIQEKMRLDLQAADYEVGLYKVGTVEYEQALARRQEIQRRFDAQMDDNKRAAQMDKNAPQLAVFASLQSGTESAMTSMLTQAATWREGMMGIYKSVGTAFVQEMITKPLALWLAGWARKLAMNAGFLTAETAQETTAKVSGAVLSKAAALSEIMANAGVAGSGAYAATALIPYVGPAMAPVAAATAFAGASAFGASLFSASGGFDIPRGLNPMTQLHEEEMVIPAKLSNGIRDMINGGNAGGGGGGGGMQVTYNDNSGRLTKAEIERNAGHLAQVLRKQLRNFAN